MGKFNIKEFLTENKLTEVSKLLDEARGFDSVEEFNSALKDIQTADDAERLFTNLWNGQQDNLLAKLILHAGNRELYQALANAIQELVARGPDYGPFDRL